MLSKISWELQSIREPQWSRRREGRTLLCRGGECRNTFLGVLGCLGLLKTRPGPGRIPSPSPLVIFKSRLSGRWAGDFWAGLRAKLLRGRCPAGDLNRCKIGGARLPTGFRWCREVIIIGATEGNGRLGAHLGFYAAKLQVIIAYDLPWSIFHRVRLKACSPEFILPLEILAIS